MKPLYRLSIFGLFCILLSFFFIYKKENCSKRPDLTIFGFILMADGLGRQSVEIIDELKDQLIISYKGLRGTDNLTNVPEGVKKVISKKHPILGKVVIYEDSLQKSSHLFLKRQFKELGSSTIRIAYSMFESTLIPPEWVHILNLHFDVVVVPDQFCVDVYKNSGVKTPIFVLPLGLNLKPFLNHEIKTSAHDPFVFANFSAGCTRKNLVTLVEGFHKAFNNDPKVVLKINLRFYLDFHYQDLKHLVKELGATNIFITHASLDSEEYLKMFSEIDCYVSLSQGEGFSIQPREAMALGIPILISDATAQGTISESGLGISLHAGKSIPAFYENFAEVYGERFDVEIEDVVTALREMKERYPFYLKQNTQMRKWASRYDYANLRSYYINLVKPKKVILGDQDLITKDYLMTTSPTLYQKYKSL